MQATKISGLLAVAVIGLIAGTATAQDGDQLDRLAVQLQRQSRDLHREIDTHARNAPQYRELHRDVGELERLAAHLHELIERRGNPAHIRADVRKIDRLYHHVERDVGAALRSGAVSRRGAADIRRQLSLVSRTVHDMEGDDH